LILPSAVQPVSQALEFIFKDAQLISISIREYLGFWGIEHPPYLPLLKIFLLCLGINLLSNSQKLPH